MTRHWKPATILITAPVLAALVHLAAWIGLVAAASPLMEEETDSLLAHLVHTLTLLVPVLGVGLLARWLGRWAPLRLRSRRLRVPFTVLAIGGATIALLGLGIGGLGLGIYSDELGPAIGGAVVWTAVLAAVASGAANLWPSGRRRTGALTAGIGGLLAVDLGVTANLLLHHQMSTAPLGYLPLWFPASLWTGQFSLDMGWAANDEMVAFIIFDITEFYPYLLLAITAFVFGYLYSGRQPVSPTPETEPAAGPGRGLTREAVG